MTKDEAISYLESIPKYIDYNNEAYYAVSWEILEAIESAIEALKAQQWIPCSERLPEPGEYYLVTRQYFGWNCTEYREIDIAKYDFEGWHKADVVAAWCELPEPYKGEHDE